MKTEATPRTALSRHFSLGNQIRVAKVRCIDEEG
jgi:hypothetical protein